MRERAGSIYIHIPFCRDRCFYCDFYSTKYNESSQLIQDYLESIIMEFEVYREFVEERIKTIYIGGGTPSIIPVKHIDSFLKSFLKKIELLDGYEFTFEMNPESVDKGLLKLLKWYGVNRISLGAQSQNDSILKALNRAHNVSDTYTSLTDIFECGFENVSVDFLIGTTKETEEFIDEIYRLISEYPIKHISAYILTIDEKRDGIRLRSFLEIGDEFIIDQYNRLHRLLNREGFVHYEISNYALNGFESRHNLNYWDGGQYLGLGASASGYVIDNDGRRLRYKNIPDITEYIRQVRGGSFEFEEYEIIDNKKLSNEIIMLGLRTRGGFSLKRIQPLIGKDEYELLIKKAKTFMEDGLLNINGDNISPTLKGFIFNNVVVRELMLEA